MLRSIADNAGTIAVTLVLIGIVAAVIVRLIKDKKQGKSSCGAGCGCCPMAGACHKRS